MTPSQRKALAELIAPHINLTAAQVLSLITAETVTPRQNFVTDRGLVAVLGLTNATALLAVLESLAAGTDQTAAVARKALQWLQPANGGIDFGEANTRAFIAGLHAAGLIDATQKQALDALGVTITKPTDALGFSPTEADVAEADELLHRIHAQLAALTAVRDQYNASVAAGETILEQLRSGNLVEVVENH